MTFLVPGHVAPWATALIGNRQPYLLIHALFALAEPRVEQIGVIFITIFVDLILRIQEDWEILLSSIRDGIIPDVEGIDNVRIYLQVSTGYLSDNDKI